MAEDNPNLGAGVLFPTKDGKYLLQENEKEPGMPEDAVGKLRPAGGHKSKRDKDLRETIVRELGEEFGLTPDFIAPRLKLLGYIKDGAYKDCAMFELSDHGLSAKRYSASNSKYETIKLMEASLSDKRFVGTRPEELRAPRGDEVSDSTMDKKAGVGKSYKLLKGVGFEAMVHRLKRQGQFAGPFHQMERLKSTRAFGKHMGTVRQFLLDKGYDSKSMDFLMDRATGMPVDKRLMADAARASAPLPPKQLKPPQLGFDLDSPPNNYDWE